jgi:hypothetical protein
MSQRKKKTKTEKWVQRNKQKKNEHFFLREDSDDCFVSMGWGLAFFDFVNRTWKALRTDKDREKTRERLKHRCSSRFIFS